MRTLSAGCHLASARAARAPPLPPPPHTGSSASKHTCPSGVACGRHKRDVSSRSLLLNQRGCTCRERDVRTAAGGLGACCICIIDVLAQSPFKLNEMQTGSSMLSARLGCTPAAGCQPAAHRRQCSVVLRCLRHQSPPRCRATCRTAAAGSPPARRPPCAAASLRGDEKVCM